MNPKEGDPWISKRSNIESRDFGKLKLFFSYILSVCFLFSEINPFPYLLTHFGNKIVLLDIDQSQVVWMFSAERDINAMGYTADNAVLYYAQGDSLFLLNMHNRSKSEVCHYVILLKGSRAFAITLPCNENDPPVVEPLRLEWLKRTDAVLFGHK